METKLKKITGGVYLILDPSVKMKVLLKKLDQALQGGATTVQIWNNWPEAYSLKQKKELVNNILSVTMGYHVPVLMNEEWELLKTTELDGVHFDQIPDDYERIQSEINRDFIAGITCSNSLEVIRRADKNGFNYISFCSMFPSGSVDSCEIIRPETVKEAKKITKLPLFVSGGITPKNLTDLEDLDFEGIAVISGILNAESPEKSVKEYRKVLENAPFQKGDRG